MKTDYSAVGGLLGTALVIGMAMSLGSGNAMFFDPSSFLLVLGGTLTVVVTRRSVRDVVCHLRALKVIVGQGPQGLPELAGRFQRWANIARRDGTLALEAEAASIQQPFLRDALMLLVDGADEAALRLGLQKRVDLLNERHERVIATWEDWLVISPAMGMIGTLIGLMHMLGNLKDIDMLGQGMALALLTTLYGALLANVVAGPVASRLRIKHDEELQWCQAVVVGVCRIARGESPRRIADAVVTPLRNVRPRRSDEAA
ncbi:MAG: flagellar motor protein PomA [Gammaproteobacteria bacterium]|nr:flagellar motor protein PomA [Gammaproteobacteria bacterium]